jgi:beta-glucosidase
MKRFFKNGFIFGLGLVVLSAFGFTGCTQNEDKANKKKIKSIVSSMTIDQKAQLVVGTGFSTGLPDSIEATFRTPADENMPEEYKSMVSRIRTYLPGAAGFTAEFPDLGITSQVLSDGPAGLRVTPIRVGDDNTYYCTAFPIGTLLASTWDVDLVYNVGEAMGNEVLEYGSAVILAPALNLQRNPLCGRNFEYYSEDPLVTGKIAAAMVNGIQSNGVGTSIKHYAANNSETNRMSVNEIISERALREMYLKGFEIAVKESQPWTVMSSYNKINGVYASESYDLLTTVLRDDWGFKGYVMTDWSGGSDPVAQMKAGNDLLMPGQATSINAITEAINNKTLEESVLDKNVSRILDIMLKTPRYKGYQHSNKPDLETHALVARQAAAQGMVLLENRGATLPITSDKNKIAAFGNTSYEIISGGTGSGDVNEKYTVSLIEGLTGNGFTVNEELTSVYNSYIQAEKAKSRGPVNFLAALMGGMAPVSEMVMPKRLATRMADVNDIALITIGRNAGEGEDRKAEEGDFYLTATERELISTVTEAFHAKGKKVVVVLNIAGVIETASWKGIPDAVLLAWQPGQEAGNSIVDVLTGVVNPSGKLAVSFPVVYDDVPTAKTFPGHAVEGEIDGTIDMSGFSFMSRVPWEMVYDDDIYVGYRYYNTFEVPVSYEFGYGKSYTTFEYGNISLSATEFKNSVTVSVDVTNSGLVAGREVVQVYVGAPDGKLEKPEEELKAFGKTKMLRPGETETLQFTFTAYNISSFDAATSSWIVEPGTYTVKVGASSLDIKVSSDFKVVSEIVAETVNKALAPTETINKMTKK